MKKWLKKASFFGKKDGPKSVVAPTPERGLLSSETTSSSVISPTRLDMEQYEDNIKSKKSSPTDVVGSKHNEGRAQKGKKSGTRRHASKESSRNNSRSRKKESSTSRQSSRVNSRDLDSKTSSGMKVQSSTDFSTGYTAGPSPSTVGQRPSLSAQSSQGNGITSSKKNMNNMSDEELARALAEEENASYYASLQSSMAASAAQEMQRPIHTGNVDVPDINLARALAESQFAARQADEILKAKNSMFEAAVSKAMEESMSSAEYDGLLRDIKMWIIDLDAASDEVLSAVNMISRRREETASKLAKALERGDSQRVAKMLWESEKLPEIQSRVDTLQENMVPLGIATSDLQFLRDRIMASYPSLEECQKTRDEIIETMFKSLKKANLSFFNSGYISDGIIQDSDDCQHSSDLRDFISALVDDAKRIPKIPEKVIQQANIMVKEANREQQDSFEAYKDEKTNKVSQSGEMTGTIGDGESSRAPSECRTEVSSTPTELQSLVKQSDDRSLEIEPDGDVRLSSNHSELRDIKKREAKTNQKLLPRATIPKPFNLSMSRTQRIESKSTERKRLPIRRVPAFFTLHHEIMSDRGIVNQTVCWENRQYKNSNFLGKYLSTPRPQDVDEFFSEDVYELLAYVKKQKNSTGNNSPESVPGSSKQEDKWYTMCQLAGAVEGLETASEQFLTWTIPTLEPITQSCHELKELVSQTMEIISLTAYSHDTLRVAMKKHTLPWDENLISRVRSDAQHAAFVIMRAAIDCADEAGKNKVALNRQRNVLKPLGEAVIASFSVHQLAGGFGDEAGEICDELVDLTIHFARQLDPKWFRGTKVVRS